MNLDGFLPSLPRPNPHRLFARNDEDLPVTDPSRLRRRLDGLHHLFTLAIRNDHLDLHLRKKIDGIFRPPVELGMPLLSAESLHLTDREPLDADLRQGILHLVQLERLDDRFDLLHHPLPTLQESIRLPHSRGPFPFMASPPGRASPMPILSSISIRVNPRKVLENARSDTFLCLASPPVHAHRLGTSSSLARFVSRISLLLDRAEQRHHRLRGVQEATTNDRLQARDHAVRSPVGDRAYHEHVGPDIAADRSPAGTPASRGAHPGSDLWTGD